MNVACCGSLWNKLPAIPRPGSWALAAAEPDFRLLSGRRNGAGCFSKKPEMK